MIPPALPSTTNPMTLKRTYINIINAFWDKDAQKTMSAPATRVFFYIVNRINRNHWQPVLISDYELAAHTKASRRRLPLYRNEIQATGLLNFHSTNIQGRGAGIVYELPAEIAPKGTINSAQRNNLDDVNSAERNNLNQEIAPKGTINSAQRNNLDAPTPYYNNIKTYKTNTINEDANIARAREDEIFIEEVEAEEVETAPASFLPTQEEKEKNCAQKEKEKSPADLMAEARKKAEIQGAELLAAFQSSRLSIEKACMSLHVSPDECIELARETVAQWAAEGTYHDDFKGNFDYKDANKHLLNVMRYKAADRSRQPKTRQQLRQDLMAASAATLNRAIRGEGTTEEEAPF